LVELEFFILDRKIEYTRSIYGPLNLLGDVGGLADALFGIGSSLISLIHLAFGNSLV